MRARRVLGVLALAGALTLAGAQGAAAGPQGETEFEIYSVSGTVTLTCASPLRAEPPDSQAAEPHGSLASSLTGDPIGGTHPKAKEACAEIDAAGGDIAAVPRLPGVGCVDEWDAVLIGVTGTWRGKEVLYSSFEPNRCYGAIRHGHIFWY